MLEPRHFGPRSSPLENEVVGNFVSNVIWGMPGRIRDYCAMGVFDGEKLVAGVLYHNWHQDAGVIELSTGARNGRWLTRPVIRALFNMPFNNLGCQLCVIRVAETNATMIHIARSWGFTEVFIPRLRSRDEGEFIFSYSDDQWRSSPYNPLRKE